MKSQPKLEQDENRWTFEARVKTQSGREMTFFINDGLEVFLFEEDKPARPLFWLDLYYIGDNNEGELEDFGSLNYKRGYLQLVIDSVDENMGGDPWGYMLIPVDHDSKPFYDEGA